MTSGQFNPADKDDWIAHGRCPDHASILADA
ncbi:hypothetical protein V475_19735 [Sphingobium baderi LL03]|uniref:Uncharacterized protein n=1 Tax=Sphingobium baderi LL03 TaxID=1114964 RepID=T0GYS9_9SPHN|nr:hypothetical protein L485_02990 [Sphingobium baderi LL03]KMS60100.1 hypothetical protein V475_19735 [Sphingobium baderi LL03]